MRGACDCGREVPKNRTARAKSAKSCERVKMWSRSLVCAAAAKFQSLRARGFSKKP